MSLRHVNLRRDLQLVGYIQIICIHVISLTVITKGSNLVTFWTLAICDFFLLVILLVNEFL